VDAEGEGGEDRARRLGGDGDGLGGVENASSSSPGVDGGGGGVGGASGGVENASSSSPGGDGGDASGGPSVAAAAAMALGVDQHLAAAKMTIDLYEMLS
jgi:hypothetical protein